MLGFIRNRIPHDIVKTNCKKTLKVFFIPFDVGQKECTAPNMTHNRRLVLCYNSYKDISMEGCLYIWGHSIYTCRVYFGNFDTDVTTSNRFYSQNGLLKSDIVLLECSMFSKLLPFVTIENMFALDGRYSVLSKYLEQYRKFKHPHEISDYEIGLSLHSQFLNRFRIEKSWSTINSQKGRRIGFDDIRGNVVHKIQYIRLSSTLCINGDPTHYVLVVLITTKDGFMIWSQIGDFIRCKPRERDISTAIVNSICKHFMSGHAEISEIILP